MTIEYRYEKEQLLELSNEHLLLEYTSVIQALETTRIYEKLEALIVYRADIEQVILQKMQ